MDNVQKTHSSSLSIFEKKEKLHNLRIEVMCMKTYIDNNNVLQHIVSTLVGCFSSDPEVIVPSCEILLALLDCNSFTAPSISAFRRLFRYMPFFFQNRDNIYKEKIETVKNQLVICAEKLMDWSPPAGNQSINFLAQSVTRFLRFVLLKIRRVASLYIHLKLVGQCLKRFHQKCHLIGQMVSDFPFTMLFHLTLLISEQLEEMNDRVHVVELILQTLNIASHMPKPHGSTDTKIMRKLIMTSCISICNRYCTNPASKCACLSKVAHNLIQAFILSNPDGRCYWIEHRIVSIYDTIFAVCLDDIPNRLEITESMFVILNALLQQEIRLDLKLAIIEQLFDRGNGLTETIKFIHKHLIEQLLPTFNDILSVILAHYVWQFELGTANLVFTNLKLNIYAIVQGVNWAEVLQCNFVIGCLSTHSTSANNLWLILLVTYFEVAQNEWNSNSAQSTKLMLNISTLLSICCLKHYQMPKFLQKYVLEAVAKFHDIYLLSQHATNIEKQLCHLIEIECSQQIFGLLPTTIPRLKWFKQCDLHWKDEFIRKQRLEALEECFFSSSIIDASLLDYFPAELLYSVICSSTDITAQSNASMILSRVPLPLAILEKIVSEKLAIDRKKNRTRWYQYLRAIYGSLNLLNDDQRDQVTLFLNAKLHTSIETTQTVLLIDCITRIIITRKNNQCK